MDNNSAYILNVPHDDTKVDKAAISNEFPMTSNPNKVVSEESAYLADTIIYEETRNKAYMNGVVQEDAVPFGQRVTTNNGLATFHLTSDGTTTGNALFTNVFTDMLLVVPHSSTKNLQVGATTLSADKKTLTVEVRENMLSLGVLSLTNASNGLDVRMVVWGN